jgi:zinc D-Ala-D-Ala carboxypeptidase
VVARNKVVNSLKEEAKEASSAATAAAIVIKADSKGASTELLSAIQDLRKAATESAIATSKSLDNTPTGDAAAALNFVLETIAQPVERHFGKRVEITSGYRSPSVTAAVGGVPQSSHSLGEAIDIRLPGVAPLDLAVWIRDNLVFDQLILEEKLGLVHVSAKRNRADNRLQVLRQPGGPGSQVFPGLVPPP